MFFTDKKRKKNQIFSLLALFIFSGVVFAFAGVDSAYALPFSSVNDRLDCAPGAGFLDCWNSGGENLNRSTNPIEVGFKWLLYAVFTIFGWLASLAITIFEFIIKPEYVTQLFNGPGVYESWKFVRDFFNLFFILVLLYIAFTVVFQINKDFKKAILSLVLAALFVNFSFPVSRALIDATNVPMYFFSNQMMGRDAAKGVGVFGATMTASNIKGILIPGAEKGGSFDSNTVDVSRLLMAIIFIFLFSITLLVLAVMFVIRLVALVVLVIFSSVGFAASIIPGLEQYSKMWWDNFWKYALFGPAAMLMLLIATRFFSSLGDKNGPLMAGLKTVAGSNVIGVDRDFFASMALFTIPIIMLWMAMGLAQKMSIAGASSVIGLGQKVSKWVGSAPFRAGWVGAKWAGRKVDTKILAPRGLSPKGVIRGFKQYFETQRHEDEMPIDLAKARMHNRLNKTLGKLPWAHEDQVDYETLEQNKQKASYEAQIKERGGGEINENVTRLALKEGYAEHNTAKVLAATTLLSRIKGLDNISGDFAQQLGTVKTKTLSSGQRVMDITGSYEATMTKMLQDLGMGEQAIKKHMHNFGENAKSTGDNAFGDLYEPDVDTGVWQGVGGPGLTPAQRVKAHAETASGNFMKMKGQTRHDVMHGRALFEQYDEIDPVTGKTTGKRKFGDMHEVGEETVLRYSQDDEASASRENNVATAAQVAAFHGAMNPATKADYPVFIRAYNANEFFRNIIAKKLGKTVGTGPGSLPAHITP